MKNPVIVGGNGHAGTRVFAEILTLGGVFTGITGVTKRRDSEDLRIISLLTKWVRPYVYGTLDTEGSAKMKRAFSRRLRLLFPIRSWSWGFKNPRTMLLLPFLSDMFPEMKFVHVIRDGRDLSLGNVFVENPYVNAFLERDEFNLCPEEKMMLFWGRSNHAAMTFGETQLRERYLRIRWEDMCMDPLVNTRELLKFANCSLEKAEEISRIVRKPSSMGRWTKFTDDEKTRVASRGQKWLALFGYT